jgi:hypothetical protein
MILEVRARFLPTSGIYRSLEALDFETLTTSFSFSSSDTISSSENFFLLFFSDLVTLLDGFVLGATLTGCLPLAF